MSPHSRQFLLSKAELADHYGVGYQNNGPSCPIKRSRPRTLQLKQLLPYPTETEQESYEFLGHIVAHLYIAIESLDISGKISVSARELDLLRANSNPDTLAHQPVTDEEIAQSHVDAVGSENDSGDDGDEDEDEDDDDETDDENDTVDDDESANQHKAVAQATATIVSVRTWTRELQVWLKIKHDIPVELRISLAKVYFALCMCRGQYISVKQFVKMFEILTKDVRFLREKGLVLPWQDLCRELQLHLNRANITLDPLEVKDQKQLLRLCTRASFFFEASALPLIFKTLASRIEIANTALVISLLAIAPLPFTENAQSEFDSRYYIASYFYIWAKQSSGSGIGAQISSRIGAIAMAALTHINDYPLAQNYLNLSPFGVFTPEQISFIVNTLMNSLNIMNEKYASTPNRFFHGYASALVYSITDRYGIMNHLCTLMNALVSYVHPSNTGEWLNSISKWVRSLVYQYHKRYVSETQEYGALYSLPQELKLEHETTDNFVLVLLPFIRTGVQSKHSTVSQEYITSLKLLAFMRPQAVLELVLLDMYESLEGLISTHRVTVALRSLEVLARYFAVTPVFRVHLARLMLATVPGIDSNDLTKTMFALHVLASIAAFVPIYDMSDGTGDCSIALSFTQAHLDYLSSRVLASNDSSIQFEYTKDAELDALKSSTAAFKMIAKTFGQRLVQVLENLPNPSTSDSIEKTLAELLAKFVHVIVESFSPNIFASFRDDFFDFIFNNTLHSSIAEIVAEVCGCLVKRDPSKYNDYCGTLIDKIREEIEDNGAGKSRTGTDIVPRDQCLVWCLLILDKITGNAGEIVLECSADLINISYFLMDNVRGPAMFASSDLVNQLLKTVTEIRLNENRLISPKYIELHGITETCWGGFQFNPKRFSKEHVDFSWFVPQRRHVEFAIDFFHKIVSRAMQNVARYTSELASVSGESTNALSVADGIRVNLLYVGDSLAGVSFLLDPSFEGEGDVSRVVDVAAQVTEDTDSSSLSRDLHAFRNEWNSIVNEISNIHGHTNNELAQGVMSSFEAQSSFINKEIHGSDPFATEQNSKSGTPQFEGDDMSISNRNVTLRDGKIYTSAYFFGDDLQERHRDTLYVRLHQTRQSVGKSLHLIFQFLNRNFYDNTRVMRHVLYVMKIWLLNVGKERILDSSHSKVHYLYVSNMMLINRVKKPMTRMAFGARAEAYHMLRIGLHATSRPQSRVDKLLLLDVVKMSFSSYSELSSRAQQLFPEIFKRVAGLLPCASAEALKCLDNALENDDSNAIENGLDMFYVKNIETKVLSDFKSATHFFNLLYKCLQLEATETQSQAQDLFEHYALEIDVPSAVCLLDHQTIDLIRPPGETVASQVADLRACKSRKLKHLCADLNSLKEFALSRLSDFTHWKARLITLKLLIKLQSELELPLSPEVLQILAKYASDEHPIISRQLTEGISRLMIKCVFLRNYNYDSNKLYDLSYIPMDLIAIKTNENVGQSYYKQWRKERDSDKPSYFVDKTVSGWLFWNDVILVDSPELQYARPFSESDTLAWLALGKVVSKTWIKNIVQLWVSDNEAEGAFQLINMMMILSLVTLVSAKLTSNLTFDDILDVMVEIYDREDKMSHLVVSEIICGILAASRFLDPQLAVIRDERICTFLTRVFENDLSLDNKMVWNVFTWYAAGQVDWQRFPRIFECFTRFSIDDTSDSALKEATRISYLRSFVVASTTRLPHREIIESICAEHHYHRYEEVRQQVGALEAVLMFVYDGEWVSSCTEFIERTNAKRDLTLYADTIDFFEGWKRAYAKIVALRDLIRHLSPQEALNSNYMRGITTFLELLQRILSTSIASLFGKYARSHLMPVLLELVTLKEICQLGKIDPVTIIKKISQIPFLTCDCADVVAMLEDYAGKELNMLQVVVLGEFTETFFFRNLFAMNRDERLRLVACTSKLLVHSNAEIRVLQALTLSGLIHISPPSEVSELVPRYTQNYMQQIDTVRHKHSNLGFKNLDATSLANLHGATLGLGAFIHAFAFTSPPPAWMPLILANLANKCCGIPGIVGKTGKEILGKFKKNRQDLWHVDCEFFTNEQMQDLEGVLWKSYII